MVVQTYFLIRTKAAKTRIARYGRKFRNVFGSPTKALKRATGDTDPFSEGPASWKITIRDDAEEKIFLRNFGDEISIKIQDHNKHQKCREATKSTEKSLRRSALIFDIRHFTFQTKLKCRNFR